MSALPRMSRRPALGPATCLTWSRDHVPMDSDLSSQIRSLPARQKDAAAGTMERAAIDVPRRLQFHRAKPILRLPIKAWLSTILT